MQRKERQTHFWDGPFRSYGNTRTKQEPKGKLRILFHKVSVKKLIGSRQGLGNFISLGYSHQRRFKQFANQTCNLSKSLLWHVILPQISQIFSKLTVFSISEVI